ncbi:hypothetical protein AVEN_28230-1 [Araneus ventricosus]|uniref:Uncharacterized protein n=1 Tax=Araneus ventricosus TaxID=182803 RepID=A0A4Y2QM20_ARAVE|nr:hypothetical protein AVEN_28230-1 [Araneus ventricosus]
MHVKGLLPRDPSLVLGRSFGRRVLLKAQPRVGSRRAYGVALCFAARSYGGEFSRRGEGNSKVTVFWRNMRHAESIGNCCISHYSDKAVAMRATNLFYDNSVSDYHQIVKCWQEQMSLDTFLL